MPNNMTATEKDRVEEAMARYAAQPEFDIRLGVELMGWIRMPDGWYSQNMEPMAPLSWSPTTDANAAVQMMRSPKWCERYPTSVITFGSSPKAPIMVVVEDERGLTELSRDNKLPMAVSIAAIRLLGPSAVSSSDRPLPEAPQN